MSYNDIIIPAVVSAVVSIIVTLSIQFKYLIFNTIIFIVDTIFGIRCHDRYNIYRSIKDVRYYNNKIINRILSPQLELYNDKELLNYFTQRCDRLLVCITKLEEFDDISELHIRAAAVVYSSHCIDLIKNKLNGDNIEKSRKMLQLCIEYYDTINNNLNKINNKNRISRVLIWLFESVDIGVK